MRASHALALGLLLVSPSLSARADEASIRVTSPAFDAGGRIPPRYSAGGGNHSPPLAWTPAPGAKAYALTLRDPDAPSGTYTHWMVWNLPASATALPEDGMAGMVQGRNDAGSVGYFGPQPPYGVHHYHFQVLALDAPLALAAGADFGRLSTALRGHVLARGELVATFAAK